MKDKNKIYIDELSKIRTPIIYDTIEKFNVRLRDEGWMDTTIKSILPNLGTMCGYACTGKFIGEIPKVKNEKVFSLREIWDYVIESVKPSVMVVQDLDYPNLRSCAWGDISASIFLLVLIERSNNTIFFTFSSSIFFANTLSLYILAESVEAIAAIDLSLPLESSLADPAVSAEIIVLNLCF